MFIWLSQAAYYNAAALSVFFLIGVAVYNNLVIFSAFLQSLAWALLVGVGLHRVKQWLVTHTQDMLIRYVQIHLFSLNQLLIVKINGLCFYVSS
jgi:hypothetical protein